MENLYKKLLLSLQNHDKETAVTMCIEALETEKTDIITLYKEILTPALNSVIEEFKEQDMLIWQEHTRSEIVNSVIENCYKYVLKERDKLGFKREGKVIVLSPKSEDHILGARMSADIYTIAGFETVFIGSNTPWKSILKAIDVKKPDIISISVTNFYNVLEAKKTIEKIKQRFDSGIKFVLGGYAFKGTKNSYKEIGGDYYLENLEDIFSLKEEVKI